MTKAVRLASAATAAAAILAGVTPNAVADDANARAGRTSQSKNDLTCNNSWYNTSGGTNCTGNGPRAAKQQWRLRVRCSWQPDYLGSWQTGPGSDRFECRNSVQSASVEFA